MRSGTLAWRREVPEASGSAREGSPQGAFTDREIGTEVPRAFATTKFSLNSFDSRMVCMEVDSISARGRGKRDTNDNDERVYMYELLAILRGYRPMSFGFSWPRSAILSWLEL